MSILPALPEGVSVEKSGMRLPEGLSQRDYNAIAPVFLQGERALRWAIGDFVVFGEQKYRKGYDELARLTGFEADTLKNWASIARRIELSRRRDNLSFTVHEAVASLPVEQQEWHLQSAEMSSLTVQQVRAAVRLQRQDNQVKEQQADPRNIPQRLVIEQDKELPRETYATGEPDRPSGRMRGGFGDEPGEIAPTPDRVSIPHEGRNPAGTERRQIELNPRATIDAKANPTLHYVVIDADAADLLPRLVEHLNAKRSDRMSETDYVSGVIRREAARVLGG